MPVRTERVLFWVPRILVLLFAAFLSVFALDVFGENAGFWITARDFVLHLVPAGFLLLMLALAWHRERLGGVLFLAVAAAYVASTWGRFPLVTYLSISGPAAAAGLLFLAHWFYSRRSAARQ